MFCIWHRSRCEHNHQHHQTPPPGGTNIAGNINRRHQTHQVPSTITRIRTAMAASCMGSFGTYQYLRNRKRVENKLWNDEDQKEDTNPEETVWVVMRYTPQDLRATAPVPRYKPLTPSTTSLPQPAKHWIPAKQSPPANFTRDAEETNMYRSTPSTRCEEWSTLRQMLPSHGPGVCLRPPSWGVSPSIGPPRPVGIQRDFSRMSTPMSR